MYSLLVAAVAALSSATPVAPLGPVVYSRIAAPRATSISSTAALPKAPVAALTLSARIPYECLSLEQRTPDFKAASNLKSNDSDISLCSFR